MLESALGTELYILIAAGFMSLSVALFILISRWLGELKELEDE